MARAKVVHSVDACTIIFAGDKRSPEPSTGVIKFPGGNIEVSRTTDGSYWAHVTINNDRSLMPGEVGGYVTLSRIDARCGGEEYMTHLQHPEEVQHVAVRISQGIPNNQEVNHD